MTSSHVQSDLTSDYLRKRPKGCEDLHRFNMVRPFFGNLSFLYCWGE